MQLQRTTSGDFDTLPRAVIWLVYLLFFNLKFTLPVQFVKLFAIPKKGEIHELEGKQIKLSKCWPQLLFLDNAHGRNNYKDTKPYMLSTCILEFTDWRYSQSCWNFRLSFVNYCHSTFSLVHLPHPSPLPKVNVQYIKTVCGWEGLGVLSCVGDSAGVETLFLARIITFKIATTEHPKQKPRREEAQTDIHLPKVPFQVNF
jgi:hypothetical protein